MLLIVVDCCGCTWLWLFMWSIANVVYGYCRFCLLDSIGGVVVVAVYVVVCDCGRCSFIMPVVVVGSVVAVHVCGSLFIAVGLVR